MIGTNNLSFSVPQDQTVANIGKIVERFAAESPQTEIFVQSVLPREATIRRMSNP